MKERNYYVINSDNGEYVNFYSSYTTKDINWASSFFSKKDAQDRIKYEIDYGEKSPLSKYFDKFKIIKVD